MSQNSTPNGDKQWVLVAAAAAAAAGATVGALAIRRLIANKPYIPPRVWQPPSDKESSGSNKWGKLNSHLSGPRGPPKPLPRGKHPIQLYSLGTPNGVKVTILLEELAESPWRTEYDAYLVDINAGEQFSTGFFEVNPNSKIPALVDSRTDKDIRVFESGAILLHLSETHNDAFVPKDPAMRAECLNWLFWGTGSPPFVGGGFGHFYSYAAEKQKYPIDRYAMETKRQLHVLDQHLKDKKYLCGDEYSIADMAVWPWYGALVLGRLYNGSAEFLAVHEYKNVLAWANRVGSRPAVKRGRLVNRSWGDQQLPERHSLRDFDQFKDSVK